MKDKDTQLVIELTVALGVGYLLYRMFAQCFV